MIYLQYGDRLPAVGVLQRVLNECRKLDARLALVEELIEDGIFGPRTHAAFKTAQEALHLADKSGIVGPDTWRALATIGKYRIVDVTDLAIEARVRDVGRAGMHMKQIDAFVRKFPDRHYSDAVAWADKVMRMFDAEIKACRDQHERFVSHGGNPIAITRLDGVFDTIRRGLEERSRDGHRVVLLRFTGHGGPASQGVAASALRKRGITEDTLSFDEDDTPEELVETVVLSGMTVPMAKFGCVELHGCNVGARRHVGRGRKRILVNGPAYVQNFANTIGRPVSASAISDLYGTFKLDVRYEGAVVSCAPGGGTVRSWFEQH